MIGGAKLPRLRPYQCEAGRAIFDSVMNRRGLTFTVEIARQGGKNELSSQIELFLLLRHGHRDADAVKCAPTFRPQLRISMRRLWSRMGQAGLAGAARLSDNAITVGRARALFLSAEPGANVVGHTASILLEVDEAQDVDEEKFDREFRPMAATANATTVLYGTAWDDRTLLERAKQHNLELERRDGVRRHFEYDWQRVAAHVPAYAAYVEAERARLGATHPLFLTQYCLKTIAGGGRLFTAAQRAQLGGGHERLRQPAAGEMYVAGLDLAGGEDAPPDDGLSLVAGRSAGDVRDATVLTIGRLAYPAADALVQEPRVEIVEQYAWTGVPHETLLPQIVDLLRSAWKVARVAVDATGLGETAARLIAQALGAARVDAVKFTAASKSQLGFDLLASVNGGRLKMYRGDGSAESREFWRQCELARAAYRANSTLNFFVEAAEGHDDYLVSTALLVHASRDQQRRVATGRMRAG
ncbi:MAG: hypothetical protein HY873_06260 [Chloroflexi bacterium]|nr:hypothetical protein [Chloroflexota bacterium]